MVEEIHDIDEIIMTRRSKHLNRSSMDTEAQTGHSVVDIRLRNNRTKTINTTRNGGEGTWGE